MTTVQTDLQALRQAIKLLSRREREELAEWILNSPDVEIGVAEPALPYGTRRHYYTVEEYLNFEEESPGRHEYVAGQIFAMSPPIIRHQMITTNLATHLQNQLRGTPCRAFSSNAKLRMQAHDSDIFYIPDVMVCCGPFTEEVLDAQWLTDPCVVMEVVSAWTEAIDRREKVLNYRQIPSLEEYVLIAQRSMEVTVFSRSDNWRPQVLKAPEDVFESRAVEVNIPLASIYEGVR